MAGEQNGVLSLLSKSSVNQTRASLQVVPSEEVAWEQGWGQCWGHHGGPAVERGPSEPQRSPPQHVHSRHTRGALAPTLVTAAPGAASPCLPRPR